MMNQISDRLLTKEEVKRLPNGTVVWIRWRGGNGPWRYMVRQEYGSPRVYTLNERNQCHYVHAINFVGHERYSTQICRIPDIKTEAVVERDTWKGRVL